MVTGAEVKHGHMVIELLARSGNKGDAIDRLRSDGQPVVFLGDDVTDESAFEQMGGDDVAVRVGPGATAARYRLEDTAAVVAFLTAV
jgi:trehalose 6-phosphate phosphatase